MLFPAYATSEAEGSGSPKPGLPTQSSPSSDWLHNPSFKPVDALAIQQLQKYSDSESDSDDSEGSAVLGLQPSSAPPSLGGRVPGASSVGARFVDDICAPRKRSHSPEQPQKGKRTKRPDVSSKGDHPEFDSEDNKSSRSRRKKKKEKHKKHTKKHKKHKKESRQREIKKEGIARVPKMVKNKVFLEDIADLKLEMNFGLDRHGDEHNEVYESLYQGHVARYRRIGDVAMGSNVWMKDKKKKTATRVENPRYYGKDVRAVYKAGPVLDLSQECQKKADGSFSDKGRELAEFISLTADSTQPCEAPQHKQPEEEALRARVAALNQRVHEHPGDIRAWLALVELQEEAVCIREDYQQAAQTQRRTALVRDIQASVLDKAVEKNPACLELQLARLRLGALLWEPQKVAQVWKRLLFLHPNNPAVWRAYLKHRCSTLRSYSSSAVTKAYARCLGKLWEIGQGQLVSHPPPAHLEEHMLELFMSLCQHLWQCGHSEKASALYQAMLELNLNCPAILRDQDAATQLEFLETFWDSGCARFGETGAPGWDHWLQVKGEVAVSEVPDKYEMEAAEELVLDAAESRSGALLAMETLRASKHWLPWRPDIQSGESEEDCEDPERLVLFDDLKGCVFRLTSDDSRLQLVLGWLRLLGVPFNNDAPSCSEVGQRQRQTSSHLGHVFKLLPDLQHKFSQTLDSVLKKETVMNIITQALCKFSGRHQTLLTTVLLDVKINELYGMDRSEKKAWKAKCKEVKKFIKGVLKEDKNRNNLLLWERYAVLEWELDNVNESRAVLDMALMMVENPVQKTSDLEARCMLARMYRTYIELELGLHRGQKEVHEQPQDKTRLLHVLCALGNGTNLSPFTEGNTPAPTQLLKARSGFQQYHQLSLADQEWLAMDASREDVCTVRSLGSVALHWTVCYAVFQYLNVGIAAANVVFQQALNHTSFAAVRNKIAVKCPNGNEPETPAYLSDDHSELALMFYELYEHLIESHLSLVQYHVRTTVSPLSVLRVPLYAALDLFPDNLPLVSMAVAMEGGGCVTGQLRRRMVNVARKAQTPLPWVIVVEAELLRITQLHQHLDNMSSVMPEAGVVKTDLWQNGTRHQLRAWLERAVNHPAAQHSPLLWRLYLYCEMQQSNLSKARQVYYSALQSCPHSKDIYLDGLRCFPEMLQEVTDVMTEKEVRLRTPLEELALLLASKNKVFKDAEVKDNGEEGTDGSDQPNEGQSQGQMEMKSEEAEISSQIPNEVYVGEVSENVTNSNSTVEPTDAVDSSASSQVASEGTVINNGDEDSGEAKMGEISQVKYS